VITQDCYLQTRYDDRHFKQCVPFQHGPTPGLPGAAKSCSVALKQHSAQRPANIPQAFSHLGMPIIQLILTNWTPAKQCRYTPAWHWCTHECIDTPALGLQQMHLARHADMCQPPAKSKHTPRHGCEAADESWQWCGGNTHTRIASLFPWEQYKLLHDMWCGTTLGCLVPSHLTTGNCSFIIASVRQTSPASMVHAPVDPPCALATSPANQCTRTPPCNQSAGKIPWRVHTAPARHGANCL
jgi:hypothetical protein